MRSLLASVALLALGSTILLILPRWWLTEFAALGAVYAAAQVARPPQPPYPARPPRDGRSLYARATQYETIALCGAYFLLQTNYAFGAGFSAPLKLAILALAWAGLALAGGAVVALMVVKFRRRRGAGSEA